MHKAAPSEEERADPMMNNFAAIPDRPALTGAGEPLQNLSDASSASKHLYQTVFELLAEKIDRQDFPQGLRLKEGQLANILGLSRAPVRKALEMLHDKSLVREADGQGYLVGESGVPAQMDIRQLGAILTDKMNEDVERSVAWEGIYHKIKEEVTACLPFGTYRVLEAEMGRHYRVSRTVVREVLARLADRNLLEKDRRSHWITGPLTAHDIRDSLDMRRILEPRALTEAAGKIETSVLLEMRARIAALEADPKGACHSQIEVIENDLHRQILRSASNKRLLAAIDQNQLHFIVPNLFRRQFGNALDIRLIADHALILDQLLNGEFEVACVALEAHLKRDTNDILRKLRVLSVLPKPDTAPYLVNVH